MGKAPDGSKGKGAGGPEWEAAGRCFRAGVGGFFRYPPAPFNEQTLLHHHGH